MNRTRDSWDNGPFYLSMPYFVQPEEDRIVLIGSVIEFDAESQLYVDTMSYYSYFIQDESEPSVFRFDELIVIEGEEGK